MKTEHREHPLGTPGLTVRLGDEPLEPPQRLPSLMRRVVERLKRWMDAR